MTTEDGPGRRVTRDIAALALLVIVYVVTGRLGLELAYYQRNATIVWVPAGLSIAALWVLGARMAPAVLIGSTITNLWIGSSLPLAVTIAIGNTAEALAGWALVRRAGLENGLHRARDVVLFFALVVIGPPLVSAAFGLSALVAFAGLPLDRVWGTGTIWWLGNVGGILSITPLVVAFARPAPWSTRRVGTEAVLLAVVIGIGVAVGFGGFLPARFLQIPVALVPFPALVWAALRFGMRGATLASAVVTIAALLGTVAGTGPFHFANVYIDVALLWLFLATLSVSALLLAASLEERTREALAREEGEQWLALALNAAEAVAFERDLVEGRVRARRSSEAGQWLAESAWDAPIHDDDRPAVRQAIDACIRGERDTWDVEYRRVGLGDEQWVLERARIAERDDEGRPLRAFGLLRDVTERHLAFEERRRLERELERAKQLGELGLLAGGVAHDFNNLLTIVLANVEVARMTRKQTAASEALAAISEAAKRGAELSDQLLAYAGRRPMQRRDVELAALAADTVRMLGATLPAHIEIALDLADRIPLIVADPAQLRQILMNLLLNAIESIDSTAKGRVTVRIAPELAVGGPGTVLLEVRDNGEGMDREALDHLFEPFFTTKPRGRGLGMAAVHGLVRAHGGSIDVDSEPGRGTTFRVRLEATDRTPSSAPIPTDCARRSVTKRRATRALVVDDEGAIREVTKLLLVEAGYEVVIAGSAAEAHARFAEAAPDVVLLDLRMPGTSGAELLRALRARVPALPAVLMSGYSEDLLEGSLLEGTPFLAKPFREAELLARLDEALAHVAA